MVGMSKKKINLLIKEYVDKKHPQAALKYKNALIHEREEMIKRYDHIIYIKNNLMWQDTQDVIDFKYNALEAKIYCKKLHLATKYDWRLPTYSELLQLVDYFRFEPAIVDGVTFKNSNRYWTSSMSSVDYSANWYIDFEYGETNVGFKELKYNTRCVRDISNKVGAF